MFKDKKKKKYYIVILLIIISILIFLLSLIITDKRNISIVEEFGKDSVLMITRVINKPVTCINKQIERSKAKNKLYKDYQRIKKKYDKNKIYKMKYEESKKEINDLKNVLKLNETLEDTYINSEVILRNIGYFYNELTINKGKKAGIKKGMAVINGDGLIGIINKTSNLNSTVKLLTTDTIDNKISVKIKIGEDKYLYGLLVGYNKEKSCFVIEGIADNAEIPINSLVTTTGLGSDIKEGIKIGEVKEITKDNFDLARTLLVKTSVDFDDLRYVTILKKGEIK